jgi:drug/metabolite transporter (DMT)-like permease
MRNDAMTAARAATDRTALAVLVLGACLIGLAPILIRLTGTGPAAGGFWRMFLALPLLVWPSVKDGKLLNGEILKAGLFAGVLFGLDLGAWHYAVAFTSVTNSTVLSNTTPVVVTAAGWLLFREKPSRAFLMALVLALGGAAVMAMAKGSGGTGTNPPLGDVLALVAAFFYGGFFVVMRIMRRKGSSASQLMLWTSVSGAPVLLLGALMLHERILPADLNGWAACAGLALMHVVGQGAIAWSLGRLPASLASVVVLIQPVVAAGLGWAVFGESVVALQALGALMLLAGVVVAQRSSRVPAPVAPELA